MFKLTVFVNNKRSISVEMIVWKVHVSKISASFLSYWMLWAHIIVLQKKKNCQYLKVLHFFSLQRLNILNHWLRFGTNKFSFFFDKSLVMLFLFLTLYCKQTEMGQNKTFERKVKENYTSVLITIQPKVVLIFHCIDWSSVKKIVTRYSCCYS